jgi:hypothetical protein
LSIVRLCDGLGLVMEKRKREVVFEGHLAKLSGRHPDKRWNR